MNTAPEGYEKNYQFTDSKPYFLSWEVDTFMIFAGGFGLALMVTKGFVNFSIIVGSSILLAGFYDKMKNNHTKGYFWHLVYMLGFKKTKTLPPSYMRFFIGA